MLLCCITLCLKNVYNWPKTGGKTSLSLQLEKWSISWMYIIVVSWLLPTLRSRRELKRVEGVWNSDWESEIMIIVTRELIGVTKDQSRLMIVIKDHWWFSSFCTWMFSSSNLLSSCWPREGGEFPSFRDEWR